MAATEKLYYSEPSARAAEASIVRIEGDPSSPLVELDRSLFYPEGGGQPCDLGTLGGIAIASVEERDGRILHRLAGPLAASPGGRVELVLDHARRRDHAEQHSGQHLLSSTLLRLFGAATVSFHLGQARCTIDVDLPALPEEDLAEAERRVEEAIAEDYPILVHRCPPEDPLSFPLRRKLPRAEGEIRVVEIDGLDFTPCCGTHLPSTGRIRHLKILGAEKYKGMTRVSFVAGGRAASESFAASLAGAAAVRAFGCSLPELAAKAGRAAARLAVLERAVQASSRERAALEAELAASGPAGLPPALALAFADRGADAALESAKAFAARGCLCLAASLPELVAVAIAPSEAARLGEVLGPLALAAGGKGGGGAASFRASFPDRPALERFLEAAAGGLGAERRPGASLARAHGAV